MLIESRSVSPTVLLSNVHKNLVITAELRPVQHWGKGEAFLGRSSGKELALKFSKLTIYAKYDLCHGCFLRDFNKIFETVMLKSNRIFVQCLPSTKRMGYSKH